MSEKDFLASVLASVAEDEKRNEKRYRLRDRLFRLSVGTETKQLEVRDGEVVVSSEDKTKKEKKNGKEG